MGAINRTETEREIIVLRAAWDLVDSLVNHSIFVKEHCTSDTQLMFLSETHQRLFNILLADFLSKPQSTILGPHAPKGLARTDRTYLFYLRKVCDNPKLNSVGNTLRLPVEKFIDWLEGECVVEKVWLPSIQVESDIRVKRIVFLQICGDIAKHNFSRLDRRVADIERLLRDNGVPIEAGQGFLVLPEFYDWFHNHVLNYHASTIAEHLNNIRWGIFEYLQPEFERSFERPDPKALLYRFKYPSDCPDPVAKTIYWDLMNQVRTKPHFPRFTTTSLLKRRF